MGIFRGIGGTGNSTDDGVVDAVTAQAVIATNKATEAANSATSAYNDAQSASTSKDTAITQANAAQASANNASDSATSAANSFDSFDDRYLGAKSSDPSVDNDGDALITGALYFNSTSNLMKVYTGSAWADGYNTLGNVLVPSNNLSDLDNASTARTNLGLGTAATTASTDYATAAQGTKADNALPKSGGAMTGAITTNSTFDGRDVSADGAKLDGIEAGATADQTDEEIQDIVGAMVSGNTESGITVTYDDTGGKLNFTVASQTDENFTTADHTKLDGIESGATADQTAAEIRTLVDSATDSNVFTDADHTKLDGIETGATADQTAAEIRTLVDSATDSNVFTDADHTKLDGIESGATADQTAGEIKTAYESNADTNAFTDADHTKLDGIEASADVTDTANVTAAGALMDSECTSLASVKALNQGVATTDSPSFAGLTVDTSTLHVDATNNRVGIGTTSPQGTVHISAGTSGDATLILEADTDNDTETDNPYMVFEQDGGIQVSAIGHLGQDSTDENALQIANSVSSGGIEFLTGSGSGYTNAGSAMKIDTSGNIQIGTTDTTLYNNTSGGGLNLNPNGATTIARNSSASCIILNKTGSNVGGIQQFRQNGGVVGSITVTTSSTAYNTSSDYRLKENVVALTGATERLKQLNPSRFNFISDANTTVDGFLAHEVSDIVPEAISGTKDAVDADGNPEYQGIDQSKLVPLLVATIQELEARITALEAE